VAINQTEERTTVADSKTVRANKGSHERTSPVTFYRQVVAELRKVVWPTQQQLVTYFLVVMVFVLVMIAYVSVLDLGFGKAVFWLFGGSGK
jgi:preprotein translocase subunit SecE